MGDPLIWHRRLLEGMALMTGVSPDDFPSFCVDAPCA